MIADPEQLRRGMEFYQTSARGNVVSSRLSQALAVGFGVLAGLGVSLVVDGHAVGVAAAGIGGYLSWKFAGLSGEEVIWALEDSTHAAEYESQLAQMTEPTEGLG